MLLTKKDLQVLIDNLDSRVAVALAEATLSAYEAHEALEQMLLKEINKAG
jgi:hypothetical protein